MAAIEMTVTVTHPYEAKYLAPIEFAADEPVLVQRADDEFPGWHWCITGSGLEGWVHHSFLRASTGTTSALAAYSARELTVQGGERARLGQRLDGWGWISLEDGRSGWIPESCFAEIDETVDSGIDAPHNPTAKANNAR